MGNDSPCPLCEQDLRRPFRSADVSNLIIFDCAHCGQYYFTEDAREDFRLPLEGRRILAAFVRERTLLGWNVVLTNAGDVVAPTTMPQLLSIPISRVIVEHPLPSITDRPDRALLNLRRLKPIPNELFSLNSDDYPILYSEAPQVGVFVRESLENDGFIHQVSKGAPTFRITMKGWSRIAQLERMEPGKDLKQVFVAMWFDLGMDAAFDKGIVPAIRATGYVPFRVDRQESNNQITDEIVAGLRRSRFAVVDVSGHRPAVYYEAGFMQGLRRPTIFTCLTSHLGAVAFDTRQFPHITWDTPSELEVKLKNRILSTIGAAS